ncbi:MAG: hypothetical protein V1652_02400 [bacterium]
MIDRRFIYLGLFLGSILGGFIPSLWGAGMFSFSSVIFSSIGSIAGIWIVYKIIQ